MGNALDAAKFSASQGLTGVSDPTSSLSAITEGIKTLSDWKTKRDEAKEKLKKDTADQYLEAEKKAYENMPTDKTFKSNILEGLDSYKERLYTNMKLVQRGVVSANDNLIFRENATQGIGVVSDMQKNYAKIQEDYLKGARGYTKEDGTFVAPIYGSGAAALNDIHVQLNNPDLYSLTFNEKGSPEVIMYETEVGPNSIMVAKRDENGNRIPVRDADGNRVPNIKAMAFDGGNNQVMGIIDLPKVTAKLTGDGTVFERDYQDIIETKGLMGVITDDIKANKKDGLADLIKGTAATMVNGMDQQLSVLTDNGPKSEQSQSMSPRMYAMLTPAQKAETIEYNYFNLETGLMDKGEKTKYIPLVMGANNQYVPKFEYRDKEAYTNISEYSIYNSLGKSVKSAGFQPRPSSDPIASKKDRRNIQSGVDLLKKINQYTSGNQEQVTGAGEGLNISSKLKYRSVKDTVDKIDGKNVVVGLDLMLVNENGSTTPVKIPYYTKNSDGKYVERPYIDILEDKYNAFKGQNAPDFGTVFKQAESQKIDLDKVLSAADRNREREVVRVVDVPEIPIITPTTALDTKGNTAISSTLKSGAYTSITSNVLVDDLDPNQGPDLALQLESSFGQMAEKQGSNQGSNVKFEFDPAKGTISVLVNGQSVETQKITGNDESLKTAVSTLLTAAAEKGLPSRKGGKKKVSSINKTRTIAQIIKEDKVTPAEAAVIFKEQ